MNFLLPAATVFPIVFYLLTGALLKRAGKLSDTTVSQVNRLVYSLFFPFVIFRSIYSADMGSLTDAGFMGAVAGASVFVAAASLAALRRFYSDKAVLGSLFQGIVRGNMLLFALSVVMTVSGPEHTAHVALGLAILVPLHNVICTVVLEFLRGGGLKLPRLLLSLLKNPFIAGTLAGFAVKLTGLQLPAVFDGIVRDLAGVVTPLALIMLGASLKFTEALAYRRELFVACLCRLVAAPAIFVGVARAAGLEQAAVTAMLALSAVPTAVSSYVTAQEMGADSRLSGQIVAATSVLSVVTLFLWVLVLANLGWIG